MSIANKQAKTLLKKYRSGNCTPKEKALLESWYINRAAGSKVDLTEEELDIVLDEIWDALPVHEHSNIRRMYIVRVAAAAAILFFLSFGGYYFFQSHGTNRVEGNYANILPGSNKAILTLSNGHQIVLTGAKNGQLSVQSGTVITKTADGKLVYNTSGSTGSETLYNTMTTPRGGQYHLILADGTNVWLNAASSIKYPVAFTGKERKVEITGEAYFEIVHNDKMPFRVTTNGQTIEDIGTHFNVNAYADEPFIKTTLLEGSVKVSTISKAVTLIPGQQAQVKQGAANDITMLAHVDTDDVIAWKNGLFQFNQASIASVMKQVARWYNVEISYDNNKIPNTTFTGNISRTSNISQLLDILSYAGVHFKADKNKINVITN